MNNKTIFILNSGLPEASNDMTSLLMNLGPSLNNFRGRNIGNGYIAYGFLKSMYGYPRRVAHLPNVWEQPLDSELVDRINNEHSHLVFVMQDFIRESFQTLPFDRISEFLQKIHIPVVPLSLGANSFNGFDPSLVNKLSAEQVKFLNIVSEKSKLIGVRGEYTASTLNSLGIKNVRVIGCPSFFESGPTRFIQKKIWDPTRVVTTGAFFNRDLSPSPHILQDELYFINLLFLNSRAPLKTGHSESLPFNPEDLATSFHLLKAATGGLMEFFADFGEWEKFYDCGNYCLTIGTRLHSGIFSINRGVPTIVTAGDARAQETCQYLSIPFKPDLMAQSDLSAAYEDLDLTALNTRYPILYKEYRDYLKLHGLSPTLTAPVEDEQLFQFPKFAKTLSPEILNTLHSNFADLIYQMQIKLWDNQHLFSQVNQEKAALQHLFSQVNQEKDVLQHLFSQVTQEKDVLQHQINTFHESIAGRLGSHLRRARIRYPKLATAFGRILSKLISVQRESPIRSTQPRRRQ
jgi:hypothetical protein